MRIRKPRGWSTADESDGRVTPFHPVLIAAFPVAALYARNVGEIPAHEVLWPLAAALAAALVIWGVIAALTRSVTKGALSASMAMVALFSYGHLLNLAPPPVRWLIAPLCAAAFLAVLVVFTRRLAPASLANATSAVNLASVVLVLPSCWTIAASLLHPSPALARHAGAPRSARVPPPPPASADLPDVYYIILDAYGRSDSLRTFYGFDDEPFLQALERRGFYIARQSRANYDQTGLCLASSLSMGYLDDLARRLGDTGPNPEPLRQMIDENAVVTYLRRLGYHYVDVWTGTGQTRVDSADVVLAAGPPPSDFERSVLGLTVAEAASRTRVAEYARQRSYILDGFHSLDTVAKLRGPKFVFAHIAAPHPPFVLGPNGEARDPAVPFSFADGSWLLQQLTRPAYVAGYTGQLRYVNRRVLAAVDNILAQSQRRPIIILQGDHGSRMNLDWDSQARTDLREPFSILNAYLVPPAVRRGLYAGITPVNSFRVLLTRRFGAALPLLPDRSFYSTAGNPYCFSEVTGLLPRTVTPARQAYDASKPRRAQ